MILSRLNKKSCVERLIIKNMKIHSIGCRKLFLRHESLAAKVIKHEDVEIDILTKFRSLHLKHRKLGSRLKKLKFDSYPLSEKVLNLFCSNFCLTKDEVTTLCRGQSHLKDFSELSKSVDFLCNHRVTASQILNAPWLLHQNCNLLETKFKAITKCNLFESAIDGLGFTLFSLELIWLYRHHFRTESSHFPNHPNRIYYICDALKIGSYRHLGVLFQVICISCKALLKKNQHYYCYYCKLSFKSVRFRKHIVADKRFPQMSVNPFTCRVALYWEVLHRKKSTIDEILNCLIEYNYEPLYVIENPGIFRFQPPKIRDRLQRYREVSSDQVRSWIFSCKEEKFEQLLISKKSAIETLGHHKDLIHLLVSELNCDISIVQKQFEKSNYLRSLPPKKAMDNVNLLRKFGLSDLLICHHLLSLCQTRDILIERIERIRKMGLKVTPPLVFALKFDDMRFYTSCLEEQSKIRLAQQIDSIYYTKNIADHF